MRCLILYFSREFLEEAVGPIGFQGRLAPVPELTLLTTMTLELIQFFPVAAASSAPLYADRSQWEPRTSSLSSARMEFIDSGATSVTRWRASQELRAAES